MFEDRVQTEGVDVSSHQGNVDRTALRNSGVKWTCVKATEGTYYRNPYFPQQCNGSYDIGMIRGACHFATPDTSSGAAQADYFVDNGGGWSRDGRTLPGAPDMEWNPYGDRIVALADGWAPARAERGAPGAAAPHRGLRSTGGISRTDPRVGCG
jgi:GH25 family lysozyme M1 (1,4-beta-N-acetylmuramidase)